MITIQILGLDQFVVGHYSKDNTEALADIFGVDEEQIVFYAPNSMIFHKGVEQTSWNTVVNVLCASTFSKKEKEVADYILRTLSEFSINIQVVFSYFDPKSEYERLHPDYPRYLQEDNLKEAEYNVEYGMPDEEDDDCDDEDCDHHHEHHSHDDGDPEDLDSIYLGNAFEGFEEALEERKKKS